MRKLQRHEYPVLPCGHLDLKTGANAHFNVLTDWTPGDSHLTLYTDNGKLRIVAGAGTGFNMPTMIELTHDQTHRRIGDFHRKVVALPNTSLGLEAMIEVLKQLGTGRRTKVVMCVLK